MKIEDRDSTSSRARHTEPHASDGWQPTLIEPPIRSNPWIILLVLTLGFFMILLDTTIVNIAIPDIEKGLSAGFDQILWILNAYILVYAVLLITAGRLGDLLGPKTLFISGLIIFTLSSAACGLAQNPAELIIFRVCQGAGGAILTPQTLSLITTIFPPERRGAAFGIWGAVAGVAAVVGPTLGGFLVTAASWRAIFYINVPIGVFAVAAAYLLMPSLRTGRRHEFDFVGVILASSGLFLGVFALIEGQRFGWGPILDAASFSIGPTRWAPLSIYSLLVYSAVLLVAFVLQERRRSEPLLPLTLFRDRNYSVANIVSLGVSYSILSIFLPLTIFFQTFLGFSAVHAGLTLIPLSGVALISAPLAGRLTDRVNGKYVLMFGTACFGLGILLVVWRLSLSDTSVTFILPLMVAGLGMGCTFAPMVTLAMRDVVPAMAGVASGFLNTVRQVGQALGGAVGGAILANAVATQIPSQAQRLSSRVPAHYRHQFLGSFAHFSGGSEQFGVGQHVTNIPKSVPASIAARLTAVGHQVVARAFVEGMHPPMLAAACVLLLVSGVTVTMQYSRRQR